MARKTLPFVPVGSLLRNRLDNLETLKRVDVPIVVIHNRDDEIVPFEMGEAIAAAAGERGRLLESDGGGHNSMGIVPGSREAELIAEVLTELR
jgi:pimeloyl-ACP methyl ester carboxylesterase